MVVDMFLLDENPVKLDVLVLEKPITSASNLDVRVLETPINSAFPLP